MVHELRADFDPLYRLSIVRDKLQAAIRYRWGDRFGEETLYWERLHEVVKIFGEVAIDRSGMVTRGEFARAFHSYTGEKIANSDLDNLLELCDPNDRGCLDLVEYSWQIRVHLFFEMAHLLELRDVPEFLRRLRLRHALRSSVGLLV